MRRLPLLLLTLATGVAACDDPVDPADRWTTVGLSAAAMAGKGPAGEAVYEVTITNLLESGQALTPPLLVTHRRPLSLFKVGRPASAELQQIAENGDLGPMEALLAGERHVAEVAVAVSGEVPPLEPGETVSREIGTERGARYLSFVSMLICTNDGFTGVSGQRLPGRVGETVELALGAYDAGTELNTEDFADLVPPCPVLSGVESVDAGTGMSDAALAEEGVVHAHEGIQGIDDLDVAIHGWMDPVVRLVIERIH